MEMVNHPQHYNGHPSGVEAIEVVRMLTFDLGNAMKYVMRRDDKGTAVQDLKKAIWYLNDELENRHLSARMVRMFDALKLMDKIIAAEKNVHALEFYISLRIYLLEGSDGVASKSRIKDMLVALGKLLDTYPQPEKLYESRYAGKSATGY